MYIIHAPSVGVNCTWWVIFSATVTEILQGIRKAARCLTGFQTGKDRAWKGGKLEELLEIGVSHEEDKTMGFWRFPEIFRHSWHFWHIDIYWHISWHVLWHISWYVFWHYSDILFELLWQFDMYSAAWRLAFILTLALTWSAVTWRLDDHMIFSEAFGRKEKYLTYREHPGTQPV